MSPDNELFDNELSDNELSDPSGRLPPLPRSQLQIPIAIQPVELSADLFSNGAQLDEMDPLTSVRLRHELTRLSLLQGFDELLCLPTLRDVNAYWYQIETVRKVLKQFRGRVLLADEVGLGKTVEAGMVLKEYLLRGMAERVLILTPATLVGQWRDEMASKFSITFTTTYDRLVRRDPRAFWNRPRIIASIATARRAEHRQYMTELDYDLVIVDEAHRLKNRSTASWKLVDGLQRRFLLLLSATPVQNSLLELYNLLTLLKPGIFKTEREFRANYMTRGKPRVPANRARMRALMSDVMIRNTRSLVDVRLPPRHATTLRVEPTCEEVACYNALTRLIQATRQDAADRGANSGTRRLSFRHLLSAAGSTAATAAAAIARYIESHGGIDSWRDLYTRYAAIPETGKERQLLEVLRRNPGEKKLIFVHHRDTLRRLTEILTREHFEHALFHGGMSGPDKDRAIVDFRDQAPVLLCTESGGEGRNLQFCNTLINFDLPWNPMAIEQRIGRLHRIGQTRDVFIFNLVTRGTLEEQVLTLLDEKISMFELVVGEIDSILGELDEQRDFAELVFNAWLETSDESRPREFARLGERMAQAKNQYNAIKTLDSELFGEEFVAT